MGAKLGRGSLFVLLLGACGVTTTPSAVTSGSRLRARWQVAGGVRRLIGWHDEQLDLDCGFEGYLFGREHRCVPDALESSGGFFADAACATPLAVASSMPPPAFIVVPPENSCTDEPKFFHTGAAVDPSQVFSLENGACAPLSGNGNPTLFYRLGDPVPTSAFVAASERPGDAGQLWLVAEDGASAPWGGWNGQWAVQPTRTDDGMVRWAPWMVAYQIGNSYADSGCTTPVATKLAGSARCPLDAVLGFGPNDSCGRVTASFSAIGSPVTMPYTMQSGACTGGTGLPGSLAYLIGAPIPDGQLEPVGSTTDGGGPVQLRRATLRDRPILQTGLNSQFGGNGPPSPDVFIDASSGLACEPLLAADGKLRCIPPAGSSDDLFYTDSACTQQVLSWSPSSCDGAATPPALFTYDAGDGSVRGRPVMGAVTPTQIYDRASSSSAPCQLDAAPPAGPWYRLGDELAPDRFAEVTVEVD